MPSMASPWDHSPSHLFTVLGVAPHRDPNCVGIAIQKNRRCRLPASNISGRAQASRILDHGARLLDVGDEMMDDILNALAPLLLCHAHHQYQAGQLVDEWSRKVEKFHARRRASVGLFSIAHWPAPDHDPERARQYHSPTPHADRGFPQQRSRADAEEATSMARDDHSRSTPASPALPLFHDAEQIDPPSQIMAAMVPARNPARNSARRHRLRTTVDPDSLWTSSAIYPPAWYAQLSQEQSRFEWEDSRLSTDGSSSAGSSGVSPGASRPWSHRTVSPTTSTNSRMIHGESTRQQMPPVSSTRSAPARFEAETRTSPSRGRARPTRPLTAQAVPRQGVTRRDIEGVCNICLLPFPTGEPDADERYQAHDDDSSGSNEEACEDENALPGRVAELVWCRKQCGNNFHRACMDSWIATFGGRLPENQRQPTCPMCRVEWVEGP